MMTRGARIIRNRHRRYENAARRAAQAFSDVWGNGPGQMLRVGNPNNVVLISPCIGGGWRATYHDERGPYSHMEFATREEAIIDTWKADFRTTPIDVLSRLCLTEEWAEGLKALMRIHKHNQAA